MPHTVGDLSTWLWWISILVAPMATLSGVAATLWLTRIRQLRDRAWTARQAAYGRILAALSSVHASLIVMDAERHERGIAYFGSAEYRQAGQRLRGHCREMARAYRESAFVLAAPFLAAYERLVRVIVRASVETEDDELRVLLEAVPRAQAELVRIARDELDLGDQPQGAQGHVTPSPSHRLSTAARRTPARPSCWSTTGADAA